MCGIQLILSSSSHLSKHNLIEEEMNALKARGPDYQEVITMEYNPTKYTDHISTDHISVESPSEPFLATMAAAVLSLRGSQICKQPLRTKEVAFCWNGEVRIYRNDHLNDGKGRKRNPPPPLSP
jgi:asparagine synthetase B (glutamine-hydrolysing)